MKALTIVVSTALCWGCASNPAASISKAVVDDVTLAQALTGIDAYRGSTVRWGGMVTEVENKADETLVFVVGRELDSNSKPAADSASEGRFIARFGGFRDPLVYKSGRPLTVVGTIDASLVRPIGDYDYHFPVIAVRDSYLWAEPSRTPVYNYPPPPPWWYYNMYYRPYPYRPE